MKHKGILNYFLVIVLLSVCSFYTTAQTKKIGVVLMADTSTIYQYIGVTIFENNTKPLPLDIALSQYIEKSLIAYLTPEYQVSICELPDSLKTTKKGIFETGMGKKLSRWADSKTDEYDIIIFVKNMNAVFGTNSLVSATASGICKKLKTIYLYSTISYYAYNTANAKLMGYNNEGGDFMYHLKNVKFPKNPKDLTPEMLDFFSYEFKKYINNRIEYFISKSKLMSPEELLAKSASLPRDRNFPRPDLPEVDPEPYRDDLY